MTDRTACCTTAAHPDVPAGLGVHGGTHTPDVARVHYGPK